jgi:hypothetical protein
VHDDVADYAVLKMQLDRLAMLFAELELVRSNGTLRAMHAACFAARRVINPRYGYAIEQVGRIERAIKAGSSSSNLEPLHQSISRLENALRTLNPRTERPSQCGQDV